MRKITVYSTLEDRKKVINSEVSTWGELKNLLENDHDYDFEKMSVSAKNSQTKVQLSFDETSLPEGDFRLFIMPKQVKSGANVIDIAAVLESLKGEIIESFDKVIEEVENGEHDTGEVIEDGELSDLRNEAEEIAGELEP